MTAIARQLTRLETARGQAVARQYRRALCLLHRILGNPARVFHQHEQAPRQRGRPTWESIRVRAQVLDGLLGGCARLSIDRRVHGERGWSSIFSLGWLVFSDPSGIL